MAELEALLDFRATRRQTLAMVDELGKAQLDFRPAPDRWSLGLVLGHLLATDDIYHHELAGLVEHARDRKWGWYVRTAADLGFKVPFVPWVLSPLVEPPLALANLFLPPFLRERLIETRTLAARAPDLLAPDEDLDATATRADLRASLGDFERLVDENPQLDFNRLRYYNPLLGFNDAAGMLAFLAAHERRHHGQMRDVLATASFPRAA